MIIKTADELHSLARSILVAAGADEPNAERVSEALVSSNLSGVDTHGVWHLPHYVARIKDGELVPTARPEIISETPTSALVTGNWTFGHVAAKYGMELAVRKAKEQNVAIIGLVRAHHIGRLGEYAEMAASQNMIAFIFASGYSEETPAAVPYGGRARVLNTNPLAMGFPSEEEPPVVLDFATTTIAISRIVLAQTTDQQLPPGSIVDKDGRPTTDPAAFSAGGSLLPFGGHKGYALMVAIELLGRVLTGADGYTEPNRGGPFLGHQGVTLLAFRADLFQPAADFVRRADELHRRLHAVPPAAGFEEVLVPGDPESRARAARKRDGIPIPDDIWKSLTELAKSLGVQGT
jgi:LDH2 family malate/lactate/ureidoglycolate dehydrogenase